MSVFILKPDDIGDFVIATGAIHLLADKHGAENTILAVKPKIAPLARQEFPRCKIIGIPWQPRRPGRSPAWVNLRLGFPVLRELFLLRVDQSVCLRSARSHLHTLFFAAPRASARFAAENVLLANGSPRRRFLEKCLDRCCNVQFSPYPAPADGLTSELSSHLAVVSAALGRSIENKDILPCLRGTSWTGGGGWLICPFSSRWSKDYAPERWVSALRKVGAVRSARVIRVAGAPEQSDRISEFAALLRLALPDCPVEALAPLPLDQFVASVARADLLLTVDTAAAHLACALDAPAVVIHSGQHPGVYGPYSRSGRQIWLLGDRERLGRKFWQDSVPPEAVSAAIERALGA